MAVKARGPDSKVWQ